MPKRRKFITADEFRAQFTPEELAKADARAAELIAEELTLRDLRKALDLTQTQIAMTLGLPQGHISRLEQRSDMLLSTLASYVKAMGGDLKLVVAFPDRPPVTLTSLADVLDREPKAPRPKKTAPERSQPRPR